MADSPTYVPLPALAETHIWSEPGNVIDEKLASSLVQTAKLFARDHKYSQRELELSVEHIGPVWKKNMSWMQQGMRSPQ
jgi:hypothetical protein